MSFYAGIDPGKEGAIAVLDENGAVVSLWDLSDPGFRPFLTHTISIMRIALAALEEVHSFPRQGVASMFSIGRALGRCEEMLEGRGIPYQLVPPQRWQAFFHLAHARRSVKGKPLTKKEKAARRLAHKQRILEFAQRRWPTAELHGPQGGRKFGRADALVLAEYARVTHLGLVAAEKGGIPKCPSPSSEP